MAASVQSGTPDGKFKVDIAIKGVFLETVQAAGQAKQRVMQYCIEGANRPSIPQLLDLARYLATIQLAEMGELPITSPAPYLRQAWV